MARPARTLASISFILTMSFAGASDAAAGSASWAIAQGGAANDMAFGVAVAPDGATFVGGRFARKASFGGSTLTSAGRNDLFVAAYDPARAHLWSIRGGGKGGDRVQDIVRLPSGDIVVAGVFDTSAKLGATTLKGKGREIFIARLAATTGEVTWAVAHGGTKADDVTAVTTDAAGDVIVTGTIAGPADLGGAAVFPHRGGKDAFIAKYKGDDGSHLWSRTFGSRDDDAGMALAVGPTGDVFLAGVVTGRIELGDEPLNAPRRSAFAARFAGPTGAHRWSHTFPASGTSTGTAIAADPAGDVFVAGYFYGTTQFGEPARSAGSRDAFLVKLAAGNGAPAWARTVGGKGADTPYDIAGDAAGDVLAIGSFSGTAAVGDASLASAGGDDLFVSLYDGSTGTPVWAGARGSKGNDRAAALALDASGNPVVAGWLEGPAAFADEVSVASKGRKDVFLASFEAEDGLPVSAFATPSNSVLVNVPNVQTTLITGASTDDRAGILKVVVTFAVPGAGVVLGTAEATLQCTDERRQCTWTVAPPVNPGPMTVTASATDRANNVETPGPSITIVNV